MQILALNSVFQNSVPYVLGELGLLGLSVPCDKHSRKLRKDKEGMASTEREKGQVNIWYTLCRETRSFCFWF